MNGAPLVQCGRALPVVRRKSDSMHCVLRLSEKDAAIAWHDEDEAVSFAESPKSAP
jgi:hypothetical protein